MLHQLDLTVMLACVACVACVFERMSCALHDNPNVTCTISAMMYKVHDDCFLVDGRCFPWLEDYRNRFKRYLLGTTGACNRFLWNIVLSATSKSFRPLIELPSAFSLSLSLTLSSYACVTSPNKLLLFYDCATRSAVADVCRNPIF